MAKYFDVQGARKAGASEEAINSYMQSRGLIPKMTVGGLIGNVGSSTANLVGSTAKAVLNPFETVKNIISLAKNPQVVVDYYKQRYGKDLLETLYQDPAGVAADLSVLLGGVGGVAKLGGASKLSKIAGTASKLTDPFAIASKVVPKGIRSSIRSGISTKLGEASEGVLTKGLGNPIKQAEIQSKYGVKPAQFIKKYNLYDRSPETLADLEKSLGQQYKTIASTSKTTYNPADIIADIDAYINDLTTGSAKGSSSNQMMVKELLKRRQQFLDQLTPSKNATEDFIVDRFGTVSKPADVSELVKFRQKGIDPDIPMSQFGLSPKQSGKVAGTKKMRDILRAEINRQEPQLEKLGIDISVAKKLKPVFSGSRSRGANRQILGIPKQGATIGTVLGGIPGLAGGVALDYLTNNPKSLAIFSRGLEKASDIAKKPISIPKSVNVGYELGKNIRTINLPMSEQKAKVMPKPQARQKSSKQETPELLVKSSLNYTPRSTSSIKYKSPKLKSNVFSSRKLTRSSAY